MPKNRLDFEVALALAGGLTIVNKFPRNSEAIKAVANFLTEICTGDFVDDAWCSPENQAAWLVRTSVREMTEWDLNEFRTMFNRRFKPLPPEQKVINMGKKPAVDCVICDDKGFYGNAPCIKYCDCESGKLSRQTEGQRMLDWLNGEDRRRSSPPPRSEPLRPITQEDINRLMKEREKPQ